MLYFDLVKLFLGEQFFLLQKKYRPAVHDHVGNSVSRQSNMSAFPDSVHSEIEITNSQSVPPLYVAQDLGGQLKPKGLISELRMLDDFREQGGNGRLFFCGLYCVVWCNFTFPDVLMNVYITLLYIYMCVLCVVVC